MRCLLQCLETVRSADARAGWGPQARWRGLVAIVLAAWGLTGHAVRAELSRTGPDDVGGPALSRDARIQNLITEADKVCLPVAADHADTREQIDLKATIDLLRRSPLGDWLVAQAALRDVMVCLDGATDLEAHYRAHLHLIGLNARLDPAGRAVFLAHELAHVPQHPRFSNNRSFSAEDMVLLQRVREATAEAVATRVIWQVRQRGFDAPWRAKLDTAYGDLTRSFEQAMQAGDGLARELLATRIAFFQWFEAEWRIDVYDNLMLTTLARIASDRIGLLPTSIRLSDDFLRSIAWYADQSFLIEGDGKNLIDGFDTASFESNRRRQLDAILAGGPDLPLDGNSLSASSGGLDVSPGSE